MQRLLLFRHAKAEPAGRGQEDHERPLAPRGRAAAARMGVHMQARGYVPALVMCSTSVRTRQTWEAAGPAFHPAPRVAYDHGLYLADWPHLLNTIKAAPARQSPLMLIAHNPGVEQLAFALALGPKSPEERARLEAMAAKFPTATLAVLDLPSRSWKGAGTGKFRLSDFVKPKDLPQGQDEG